MLLLLLGPFQPGEQCVVKGRKQETEGRWGKKWLREQGQREIREIIKQERQVRYT